MSNSLDAFDVEAEIINHPVLNVPVTSIWCERTLEKIFAEGTHLQRSFLFFL